MTDIERLRGLVGEATALPWSFSFSPPSGHVMHNGFNPERKTPYAYGGWSIPNVCGGSWNDYTRSTDEANAALIVAAVNALPGLLDELAALKAEREGLREALEPFATFAQRNVDDDGWNDFGISTSRERILDWFGPSDFRRARSVLNSSQGRG